MQMAIVESTEVTGVTREATAVVDEPTPPRPPGIPWAFLVECAYAAFMLAVLTGGTVSAFWRGRVQDGGASLESVTNYTFLAAQLPAVFLLGRRISRRQWSHPVVLMLGGLVSWLLISVLWSTVKATTLVDGAALVVTCCVGVYLAISFSWTALATLLFVGLQPGLIFSKIANDRNWPGSIDETGNFAGIYGNRNSLGPPAVIATAMGAVLLGLLVLRAWRRRDWRLLPVLAAVWGLAMFDLDLQRQSGSATSWMVLSLIVAVVAMFNAVAETRWFARRPNAKSIVATTVLVACTAAFAVAVVFQSRVSEFFGRSPGFDARTSYWRADLHGIRERPFLGWGWFSAWATPEFRTALPARVSDQIWSHSAYFDVALGGGVIAIALGIGLAISGSRSAASAMNRDEPASALPLAFVVAIGFACTQESFFVGNHFYTALLVAGLCAAVAHGSNMPRHVSDA